MEKGLSQMKSLPWDDMQLFLTVARAGGLSGAAHQTGLSPPTIGRRMLALERALGRSLFVRGPTGYGLATDGEVLLEYAKAMESAALSIENWQQDAFSLPIVSVGADRLTTGFLAGRLGALFSPEDGFRICLKAFDEEIDLAHRQSQIAIVAEPPERGNFAVRRAGQRAYAAFTSRTGPKWDYWISPGTEQAHAPWMAWVFSRPHLPVLVWTRAITALADLAAAGGGKAVLPCFLGDADPRLERVGEPIADLAHESFIVMHDDDRHRPEVRTVIERLATLFEAEAALFAGLEEYA